MSRRLRNHAVQMCSSVSSLSGFRVQSKGLASCNRFRRAGVALCRGDLSSRVMQIGDGTCDDLLESSFEAAAAKYKRMHGLDRQLLQASSQVAIQKQPEPTGIHDMTHQLPPLEKPPASRIRYTKAELTDIAELCTAAPVNADIFPSLQALHLETSPPAMHKTSALQYNGTQTISGGSSAAEPNQPQGSVSQQQSGNLEGESMSAANGTQEQMQRAQQQSDNQQYSEADWAAYWQYYGHTALPPPPPPPLQLCPKHMQLLEQLCASQEAAEPQPGPALSGHTQSAPVHSADAHTARDSRATLQARAQQVQGGDLTSLLMAWFEAGYQTGRHEALSQKQS